MKLIVNGQEQYVESDVTVESLMKQYQCDASFAALAINGVFVPRQNYSTIKFHEQDVIDLVVPMQGG